MNRAVFAALAAVALSTAAITPKSASAQNLADQAHSLKIVPADAAFYSASLRLKEQWDLFVASKAYARLMEIPFISSIKAYAEFQFQESPEPPIALVRQYLASDEGREMLALLTEMGSDEVFSYGSADVADLIVLFTELNNVSRTVQIEALASGQDPDQLLEQRLLAWFDAHQNELKLPDVVIGFRVRDRGRAARFVEVLEQHFRAHLAQLSPQIAARVKRERIGDREYLTLQLDGSMLPWEEFRADVAEGDAEKFEKWKTIAAKKTLAVAIGVVDEFIVVSIGDSNEHLAKLGRGPLLADSTSLARLNRHAGERVVGISYGSEAFLTKANSPQRAMNDAFDLARDALKQSPLSAEQQTKLLDDLRGLAGALAKYFPEPGEMSAIGYLTPRGYEGFRYNTGTLPGADSSQPLSVLNHVGANPMLFFAAHAGDTIENYNQFVDVLKRLAVNIEGIAKEQAPAEEWAKYLQFRDRGIALLARLDRANRDKIYPALKANESAIVVDVASKSPQWFTAMPRSPQPLPLPEIGIVLRVSDAALLRQGVAEYYAVIQDGLKLLHETNPDDVPIIELPTPEGKSLAEGSLYSFPLPSEWGVDSQLAPNAGLTNQVAAVSLFSAFTEQLLKPTPLAIDTALEANRPAAIVSHFQFAKLIEAIRPWVSYGFAAATGQLSQDDDPDNNAIQQAIMLQAGFVLPQVNQLLDVLTTFRSYTSVTHREDGVWVTQSELHLVDGLE